VSCRRPIRIKRNAWSVISASEQGKYLRIKQGSTGRGVRT
jgi:hypothetical protein